MTNKVPVLIFLAISFDNFIKFLKGESFFSLKSKFILTMIIFDSFKLFKLLLI